MRKKLIAAMMAGVLSAGMFSTGVFAAGTDLKGEVNTFIAASLSNAMEEIQKDFNETYPDVEILYNADSSGTLQRIIIRRQDVQGVTERIPSAFYCFLHRML